MNDNILKEIENRIQNIDTSSKFTNTGIIESIGDGIATARGLGDVMQGELVEITNSKDEKVAGLALNLEEDSTGIIILGSEDNINEGNEVRTTGQILSVPIGKELIGRVVNPLGQPVDGKGNIKTSQKGLIEKIAPGVITRKEVNTPLQTGIKSIDAMIPIGRGQRELIIGDRGTGKTAIALDTIINQGKVEGNPVICIYCAIGQKTSKVARISQILEEAGAMEYTIIVSATASDPVSYQYIAPYAACAMGEYFRDNGMDALIVYDDLTKHAWAYRQISLLLRRPAGREAYPGDIFYLHSRLLERAARLSEEYKGGSLTALPIIETQAGDISAYIPTNLISITDGQIYLETDLFYAGQRPAISVGLSVSRVGGSAQIKAMKQVSGKLKLDMAQFRDLAAFAQFGSDLDPKTQAAIQRGMRANELMKQNQFSPIKVGIQVVLMWAFNNGYLDKIEVSKIQEFEKKLTQYLIDVKDDLIDEIEKKKTLDEELESKIKSCIEEFQTQYGQY